MKRKLNCILLIEDNRFTNIFNSKMIQGMHIAEHIHIAENGQEGLNYLTNSGKFIAGGTNYPKPDLIILDINMPIMNGWEFIEEYKKLSPDQKSEIVLLMLTTSPNPDDEQRAKKIKEITDFRRKLLTREMLEDIIKKYFPGYFL